jgi:hypothetical protein
MAARFASLRQVVAPVIVARAVRCVRTLPLRAGASAIPFASQEELMRRLALLLPVVLGGCLMNSPGVPAPAGALSCAEQAAAGLGYYVTARSDQTSFKAEKQIPGDATYRVVGEISASFWTDPSGRARLRVDGGRYEERGPYGGTARAPGPVAGQPGTPGTGGLGGVSPVTRVSNGNRARRRISPGIAAMDAQTIQRQCTGQGQGRMAVL